jgi:hypothetical protein
LLIAGLAVILLCGCAKQPVALEEASTYGTGEIKFSVSSMATYRYYSDQKHPGFFVVTLDGERGFYTYCSVDMTEECREHTPTKLLEHCREFSNKTCKVFAVNGNVVWKNPGSWRTKEREGMHFFVDHRGIRSHQL